MFDVKRFTPTCDLDDTASIFELVGLFLSAISYSALDEWLWMNRMDAVWSGTRVLWGELPWFGTSVMTRDEAFELACEILSLIPPPVKYLTNHPIWRKAVVPLPDPIDHLDGWMPVTQASYDTGVIVVGLGHIGILRVMEEDCSRSVAARGA